MQLLTVQFPDGTDITIARGAEDITVSDGTNTIEGGKLVAITDIEDPEFIAPTEPVPVLLSPLPE